MRRFLDAHVKVNDGLFFGEGGRGFIRLNISCPRAQLNAALERMKDVLYEKTHIAIKSEGKRAYGRPKQAILQNILFRSHIERGSIQMRYNERLDAELKALEGDMIENAPALDSRAERPRGAQRR